MSSLVEKVKDKLNLGKSSDKEPTSTQTTGSKHSSMTRKHPILSPLRPPFYMTLLKTWPCAMAL